MPIVLKCLQFSFCELKLSPFIEFSLIISILTAHIMLWVHYQQFLNLCSSNERSVSPARAIWLLSSSQFHSLFKTNLYGGLFPMDGQMGRKLGRRMARERDLGEQKQKARLKHTGEESFPLGRKRNSRDLRPGSMPCFGLYNLLSQSNW